MSIRFQQSDNSKWRWWMWTVPAYRQTHGSNELAWSAWHWVCFHQINPMNSLTMVMISASQTLTMVLLRSPYGIGQTIIFSSCGFFFYPFFSP